MSANESRADVLVVDDEESMREILEVVLGNEGHKVETVATGEAAMEFIRNSPPKVFVQDVRMGGLDGMDLLREAKNAAPEMPIILITAYSSWDTAVTAMRVGAFDYLKKPFDTDHIRSVVQRALQVSSKPGNPGLIQQLIVGNTPAMQRMYDMIKKIAPTDSTVLLHGESGSGKELVARSIHISSHRSEQPFLAVNCSAFNENLLESELFGHKEGAFTGATSNRKGLFQAADGGTLFLDEVAEMSVSTQVRMLRVLEERRVTPVGDTSEIPVDVRIIAATHKDLEEEVAKGNFREDLFYRLNVIPVTLPPLRDRIDDIPLLSGHFLAKYSKAMGKRVTGLSLKAQRQLMGYGWPGNVRELENVIQRHVALCDGEEIPEISLPTVGSSRGAAGQEDPLIIPEEGMILDDVMDDIERHFLARALDRTDGNLTQAAKILGMSYRSIRYKVKKLNVKELLQGTNG